MTPPLDKATLTREVEERQAALFEERLSSFDADLLRWLALVPEWTDELAIACGFPGAEDGLDQLLERARLAGLCEVRREEDLAGAEAVRFWMPPATRASLLELWQMDPTLRLGREIEAIAGRIFVAHRKDEDLVSPGVLRWAELATSELSGAMATGESLGEQVEISLGREDTGRAGELIFAGESLGQALGAEVEMAASRAQRRLNLHYRRAHDARYLKDFVPRTEQMGELADLIKPGGHWAVHFIGHSGTGKTMLMRYLTSHAEDRPIKSTARIDFDYIDPRFPLECPAQLLYELGVGLAADLGDGTQEALFRSFLEAVTEAEAAEIDTVGHDPLQALQTPEFAEVIASFAQFVNSLPPPVVLILDTCEELAKLHPAGDEVPSIAAMFEILERVQKAASEVRAIFAGRRWLTHEAANLMRTEAMPGSVMSMKPRPYMRMHEVRGFTRREVVDYLGQVCDRRLTDAMLETVLEITADAGSVPSFGESRKVVDEPRFNPTDVALLGGWLAADPTVTPGDLAGGNLDPYVEQRILGRLRDSPEVLAAIPAAILLQRFDSATIWPALGRDSDTRHEAFNGLLEQEWTHLDGGVDPGKVAIQVDRGTLPRLRSYYERLPERMQLLDNARSTLAPHLMRLIEQAPAGSTPDAIDAALRLLPSAEAVRRFDRMAARVAATASWPWAEELCARLLSPERNPPLDPGLEPSVGALYVAALRHRSAGVNLRSLWEAVAESAPQHPDPEQRLALEVRGRLGALAAAAANGGFERREAERVLAAGSALPAIWQVDSPLPFSLLAAAEALVDATETRRYPIPVEAVEDCLELLLERFAKVEPLRAFVLALAGRMQTLCGNWAVADEAFDRVERLDLRYDGDRAGFADWIPPDSIQHRILLELLRFRLADGGDPRRLLDSCEEAAREGGPDNADSRRLLSLVLQAKLASGTVDEEELAAAWSFEGLSEAEEATAPAHRAAPPLFVSVAECMMAAGRAEWALRLLAERERAAASRRTDEDATRAAAMATVRILRRLRLAERTALVASFSNDSNRELRGAGLAAGSLIAGLQPPGGEAERDPAAWRARNLLALSDEESVPRPRDAPRADLDQRARLHAALDRLEAELLRQEGGGRFGSALAARRAKQLGRTVERADLGRSIREPLGVEAIRLGLRLSALLDDFEAADIPLPESRGRLLGEIAFEEGELLALRLPRRAIPLLGLAAESLGEAGDVHSAFAAELRLAIAEVHANLAADARARRPRIVARYEAVSRADPDLPSLERLLDGGRLVWEEVHLWQAWLRRLGAYLDWCKSGGPPPAAGAAALAREPELALIPAARATDLTPLGPGLEDPDGGARIDGFDIEFGFAPPDEHAAGVLVEARVTPWQRTLLARLVSRLRDVVRLDHAVAVFPLREAAEPGSRSPLAQVVGPRLEAAGLPVRLGVIGGLAQVSWERRLLDHLAFERGWDPDLMPEVWRVRPPSHFVPPIAGWPRRIAAVCAPSWAPVIASQAGPATDLLVASSPEGPGPERLHSRAAIALGSPVITRAGWRLRLDDDELSRLEDPSRHRAQQLLSADRLAREAPIVVVVGRPSGPKPAIDRRLGEGLRGFANDVFLAGAWAVIAVPALPSAQAGGAIALLADELATWPQPPSLDALHGLVRRLRSHLYGHPRSGAGEESEEERESRRRRAELALEVCLFAPR